MFPINKYFSILILVILLVVPLHANEEFLELQRMYKEMFGIDLVDEDITEEFQIIVNGSKVKKANITYKNMSLSYNIPKEEFINMLEENLQKGSKKTVLALLPDQINATNIKDKGFLIKINIDSKTLSITIPPDYSKEYIINLRRATKAKKKIDTSKYLKPDIFSNYSNLNYTQQSDHIAQTQTKTLQYNGAIGTPITNILYSGNLGGRSNQLEKVLLSNRINPLQADVSIGTQPITIASGISSFGTFQNEIVGIVYKDKRPKVPRKIINTSIKTTLKEQAILELYINNRKIYNKKHYPGKYELKNFNLTIGKNNVVLIQKNIKDKKKKFSIKKTYYKLGSYAPGKFDINWAAGNYINRQNLEEAWLTSTQLFQSTTELGILNNLAITNETVIANNKLFQSNTLKAITLIGNTETGIANVFADPVNKGKYNITQSINWDIPRILNKIKDLKINTTYTYTPELTRNDKVKPKKIKLKQSIKTKTTSLAYTKTDDVYTINLGRRSKLYGYNISNTMVYTSTEKKPVFAINIGRSFIIKERLALNLSSSTDTNKNYQLSFMGSYNFNYKNQLFIPKVATTVAKNSDPNTTYSADHEYEYKDSDKEITVKNSINEQNINSSLSLKEGSRQFSYNLNKLVSGKTKQKIKYSNEFATISIAEANQQTNMSIATSIAFTTKQMGIASRIPNGFTLFKPSSKLAAKATIFDKSRSFISLSAVGKGIATYKPKSVKYEKFTIHNTTRLSSESFNVIGRPHKGYNLTALDYRQFWFKAILMDKQNNEFIEFGEMASLTNLYDTTQMYMDIIYEDGKLNFYDIKPGIYMLSVYGYKPVRIDASKVGYTEIMDLGKLYLEDASNLRRLYD